MRFLSVRTLIALGASALLAVTGCKKTEYIEEDAYVEPEPDAGPPVEGPVTKKDVGGSCTANTDCLSNICYAEKCAKACSAGTACGANEDCGSDDGKRASFCYPRAYAAEVGQSCAATGTCPEGMKCFGGADVATAFCSGECKDDTGCPPTFTCREFDDTTSPTGKRKWCARRGFCGRCQHDGQCAAEGKCVKQGKESFCTLPCNAGSTECPRMADCKDVGGGSFQCVHRAGTCAGDGGMCQPCVDEPDCQKDALCLTFNFTKESFCATSCPTKGETCGGSDAYTCEAIPVSATSSTNQCVPKDEKLPTCLSQITPTMEVGDIVPDFAVVGYADDNGDFTLKGEKYKVVKLSDFALSSKIILFNVAAGWCGPCMLETTGFAALMQTYKADGLMIVQVLYDGMKQGERPTKAFLDKWVNGSINTAPAGQPAVYVPLNPIGACGIDPNRDVSPYNTASTTPLNMFLDAKTRKVLMKFNAAKPPGYINIEAAVKGLLGL